MKIDKNVLLYVHKLIHRSYVIDLNNEYHAKIKYSCCTVHGNGCYNSCLYNSHVNVCNCCIAIFSCYKYYKYYNHREISCNNLFIYTRFHTNHVAKLPSRYFYTLPDKRLNLDNLH